MTDKLAPWARPVNVLDTNASEQISENGRQAGWLHEFGYTEWTLEAQEALDKFLAIEAQAKAMVVERWD